MEGIINQNGELSIFRNKEKFQYCPKTYYRIKCGDWCSLFEESNTDGKITAVYLNCAEQTALIPIKKDEREY